MKGDRDAWGARNPADEDIVRPIPGGTVIKTRIDKKGHGYFRSGGHWPAPALSAECVAIACRVTDGQKGLLSLMDMGGESKAAWAGFPGAPDARGLKRPELVIGDGAPGDGAPGLQAAPVALRGEELPVRRCTVHEHCNLMGHAPIACRTG